MPASPKKEEPVGRPSSKSISMFDDDEDKDDDLFGASGKTKPPPVTQVIDSVFFWGKKILIFVLLIVFTSFEIKFIQTVLRKKNPLTYS